MLGKDQAPYKRLRREEKDKKWYQKATTLFAQAKQPVERRKNTDLYEIAFFSKSGRSTRKAKKFAALLKEKGLLVSIDRDPKMYVTSLGLNMISGEEYFSREIYGLFIASAFERFSAKDIWHFQLVCKSWYNEVYPYLERSAAEYRKDKIGTLKQKKLVMEAYRTHIDAKYFNIACWSFMLLLLSSFLCLPALLMSIIALNAGVYTDSNNIEHSYEDSDKRLFYIMSFISGGSMLICFLGMLISIARMCWVNATISPAIKKISKLESEVFSRLLEKEETYPDHGSIQRSEKGKEKILDDEQEDIEQDNQHFYRKK